MMIKLCVILTVFVVIGGGRNVVIAAPPTEGLNVATANEENTDANSDDLSGAETFGFGFYGIPPYYGYGGGYYVPRPAPIAYTAGGYGGFGYGYDSQGWGYGHVRRRPIYPVWG